MIVPLHTALLALVPLAPLQENAAPSGVVTVTDEAPAAAPVETTAEELRARIKEMRMNLLLGGDQVREAEREASAFYTQKSQSVERRIDDVATELTELRATYDVALDRALDGRGTAAGAEALAEAQPLRARIGGLESEMDRLEDRRSRLSDLVYAVEERERERQRLVDQLESQSVDGFDLTGMPPIGIGLAPNVPVEAGAPFEDDALMADLLARDPRGARALIYSSDPVGYWQRFPLTPPKRELGRALGFPRPDPVGRR
ncbi:MAG: hypothetical protein AAFZ87_02865 [Planctomycetota bacterium]